jgi:hypothetical protein
MSVMPLAAALADMIANRGEPTRIVWSLSRAELLESFRDIFEKIGEEA